MLVLTDSHGRGSGAVLNECLGSNFDVFVLCKPDAGLAESINDVERLSGDFASGDVILLWGA